jgi:hypothetical protein
MSFAEKWNGVVMRMNGIRNRPSAPQHKKPGHLGWIWLVFLMAAGVCAFADGKPNEEKDSSIGFKIHEKQEPTPAQTPTPQQAPKKAPLPKPERYDVAIQLTNGKVFEADCWGQGIVNAKGEFLMEYNKEHLNTLLRLYLNSWEVSDSKKPHFDGKAVRLTRPRKGSYYSSERIGPIVKDTYYNKNGEVVWVYTSDGSKDALLEDVEKAGVSSKKYMNVNQFLIQKYGINLQTTVDPKNKRIVFKIPEARLISAKYKTAVQLKNGNVIETSVGGYTAMDAAVNGKGELLIPYERSSTRQLALIVGLYLGSWAALEQNSSGNLRELNERSYYHEESIRGSYPLQQKHKYYNQNKETVWSYLWFEGHDNPEKNTDALFEKINPEKAYLNLSQFLLQKYGIGLKFTFEKNKKHPLSYPLIVFEAP